MNLGRVALQSLVAAAIAVTATAHARAATEFCPATIAGHVAQSNASHVVLRIGALTERTVTGFVRLQSDRGWFSVPFTNIHLAPVTQSYDGGGFSFSHSDFVSPDLLIQLPAPATIQYAYVSQGTTQGEKVFGWDAKGTSTCQPPPIASVNIASARGAVASIAPEAVTLVARPMDDPFPEKCDVTSAPIRMTKGELHMPAILAHDNFSARPEGTTGVIIAVDDDGTVLDEWLWQTSGTPMLDNAVIDEAKSSKFAPGRAFCRNVPGFYLLQSVFKP